MRKLFPVAILVILCIAAGCRAEDQEAIPGMTWRTYVNNPVIRPSGQPSTGLRGWYNHDASFPWVIYDDPDFKMWFTGINTEDESCIGYATSSNGVGWQIYELAVFEPASPGSWDSGGVWCHCVIKETGPEYKMFYTGYEIATCIDSQIGLATSLDGLVWTRASPAPIAIGSGPADPWYEKAVYSGTVIASGTTYCMWFCGVDTSGIARTGYTCSTDCVGWETPVVALDAGPSAYDSEAVLFPSVLCLNGLYHMWYTGYSGTVYFPCYATSADGISWVKQGVILHASVLGIWENDYFVSACVLLDNTTLKMWYAAAGTLDASVQIGFATSPAP